MARGDVMTVIYPKFLISLSINIVRVTAYLADVLKIYKYACKAHT